MTKAGKVIGRPRKKPTEGERNHLGLRTTAELKTRLEDEAKKSGRSLSQEAEYRLEHSFWDDEARETENHYKFHGPQNYAIALTLARIAGQLGDQVFAPWTENEYVYRQVREAFDTFLDGIAPPSGAAATGGNLVAPVPKDKISGKDLAEFWLEFLQGISEMDEKAKAAEGAYGDPINIRRVAFEVEPEIAPLIGRKESNNE